MNAQDSISRPKTRVALVTYQSRSTVRAALEPLREPVESGKLEVVVVDNASADGTAQFVRDNFAYVQVVDSGGNLGFGRGCNRGAEGARTEYILFLNPDATMTGADIQRLSDFLDARPNVGVCGPSVSNQAQRAGMLTRPADVAAQSWGMPSYPDSRIIVPGEPAFKTNWVCGAAMMIRRELFERLGGFDPRFFLYFEETDLCRRVLESGAEIWVVPGAVSGHDGGASAKESGASTYEGNIAEHFFQSRFYYLSKHYGVASAVAAELLSMPPLLARAALGRSESRTELRGRARAGFLRKPPRRDR